LNLLFQVLIITTSCLSFELKNEESSSLYYESNRRHLNQRQIETPIRIDQSDNIYILAKYGQTVSLPCVIVRQNSPDLMNVN
jgi:hypothetical protein